MKPVYCIASNVTSPLGLSTNDVWMAVTAGRSAVRTIEDDALFTRPVWGIRLLPGAMAGYKCKRWK